MKITLKLFMLLLSGLLIGCKKDCNEGFAQGGPAFMFYLFHADTGLPLITNDSTSPYPIHSVKLVAEWGNGWTNTNNFNDPNGPRFGASIYPWQSDTSRYYLHFLTTGDIDTLIVKSRVFKNKCSESYSFRYFFNNEEVPVDSTHIGIAIPVFDFLTIRKRP